MNLARESFYTLIFQISGFVCLTIAGIIIARALGPSNKGIVAVILLYPLFFSSVFNFTVGSVIIHHMGQKEYDAKTFVGSALVILVVISALVLSIYLITIVPFRETLYKNIEGKYLIMIGVSVPFYFMLYYFSSILQGCMDIKGYNIANQLLSFSNLFFILMFIVLWKFTVLEAIVAGITGIVLGGVFSFLKAIKKAGGISFNRELTKRLLKDGAKIHMGALSGLILRQANIFILNYYAAPAEVGFYSVAYSIATALLFFSVSLEIGLYPKVAHATMEEAVKLVQVATRQILLITIVAVVITAVFSKVIVLIYGGKAFLPSMFPLLLLLPGTIVYVIPKILSTLWLRKRWFFQLSIIATATAVLSLILNLLLIPKFGANGAALATTATYGASSLIGIYLFWRYVSKDLFELFVPKREDMAIYLELVRAIKK